MTIEKRIGIIEGGINQNVCPKTDDNLCVCVCVVGARGAPAAVLAVIINEVSV